MAAKLDAANLTKALADLPRWRHDPAGQTISREFSFADFSAAFGFMTRVALAAQAADHHPDWSNSYNQVVIRLSTHDAGGITDRDIALARAIDKLAG